MIEVGHEYVSTFILEGDSDRTELLREFLARQIEDAEYDLMELPKYIPRNSSEICMHPLFSAGAKEDKRRAEEASETLPFADYVCSWGEGYVLRLISDEEKTKIVVYKSLSSGISDYASEEIERYSRYFSDSGFALREVYDKNDEDIFWFDYNGGFGFDEAAKEFGLQNVRQTGMDNDMLFSYRRMRAPMFAEASM